MLADKIFFIYVAKEKEWQQRQKEDWNYVYSMTRFYHWWIKHHLGIDFTVDADILPVIPGKLFDRMSIAYLVRDHEQRSKNTYHFYLTYSKPLLTDCPIEGYSADNFGMIQWQRPNDPVSDSERERFFADRNCAKVSHVLCHEILRMKGKKKKEYFEGIHELWDEHIYKDLPFLYYNDRFVRVTKDNLYRFVTLDINRVST